MYSTLYFYIYCNLELWHQCLFTEVLVCFVEVLRSNIRKMVWFAVSLSTGEVHFSGLGSSPDHPGRGLCGLGEQLSEHIGRALGDGAQHSPGPVGMQHGASRGVSAWYSTPLGSLEMILLVSASHFVCVSKYSNLSLS